MKIFKANRNLAYVLVFVVMLAAFLVSVTSLSRAGAHASGITIVNNSSRERRHLFLSPRDSNNCGKEQLHDSTVTPGSSFTVADVSCAQGTIKVIAEDQNGCFLYQTVSCVSDTSWTITNDATPDCGN